jgi:hypothetical protein
MTVAPSLTLFGLLWLIHVTVIRQSQPVDSPKTDKAPQISKTRNEFLVRAKPLEDTWRGRGDYRGWFTFMGVLIAGTTIRVMMKQYLESGTLFSVSSSDYIFRVFVRELPEFLGVMCFQYGLCLCSFGLQKAMVTWRMSSRGRKILEILHWILVLSLFSWSCLYAYRRLYFLSFTARFAIVAQGTVLCMKMHSYTSTNAQLFRQVSVAKKQDDQGNSVSGAGGVAPLSFAEVKELLHQRGVEDGGIHLQGRLGDTDEEHAKRVLEMLKELDEYRATVYPKNVTLRNFLEFTTMPVLVYEPRYPRSSQVDWLYVLQKTAELVGLKMVGWLVLERSVIPVINDMEMQLYMKVVELLAPVSLVFMVLFFIVFDCIFPALAEITKLADRGFYGDWWNSTSFADFSSSWNKPVHEFLLRHVHVESIKTLGLSRKHAAMLTFGVSIVLHEILITAIFGMFRPYLAFFSIFQIPLWPIMRSPVFRHKLSGNVFFWTGLVLGITLVVVLYFSEYCSSRLNQCTIG